MSSATSITVNPEIELPGGDLPSMYQNFIAVSRYARWIDSEGRRETWSEVVDRYINFFRERKQITEDEGIFLGNEIKSLRVMPSMRCLMSAGEALKRDELAGYNCLFMAIEDVRCLDELMYILMCGTGVGFSVEQEFIERLPPVAESFFDTPTTIIVADSKIGWASAFRELLSLLWVGKVPLWDMSRVRPAGARLKTFGGRASGPDPLDSLFRFSVNLIKNAAGRKLTSTEVHDLVCKIADIVVVGGVRRSALLSLSNLNDDQMRKAKSGNWGITHPHRALANNSAAYNEKPPLDIFLREWISLYESHSGERGIFSRIASQKHAAKNGRRDATYKFGTNPCCFTENMRLLTADGYKTFGELAGLNEVEIVNNNGDVTIGKVWVSGKKSTVNVNFVDNSRPIQCTPDHLFMLADGTECMAKNLPGKIVKRYGKEDVLVTCAIPKWTETVYDFTEPTTHWGVVENCVVHNSEIILRSKEMCNLSEVVVRANDTLKSLKDKVKTATILGTLQSSLTDFRYLRKEYSNNGKEESLLGVSLTGIMDNKILAGLDGHEELAKWLEELKEVAIETNKEWAAKLGVNPSVAITCVKPSGTVSQLVNSASGIHPRYSQFYIRRVRADKKDPLAQFMMQRGFPCEADVTKESVLVFSFPIRSPEGCITRNDFNAIEQLKLWKVYQDSWCEHKPSITVYYKDSDFLEVGDWVYKNFDSVSGVSFLPHTDHVYKQAPYEEITEGAYNKMVAAMPSEIDWKELAAFEKGDTTTGTQELACSAGLCEI